MRLLRFFASLVLIAAVAARAQPPSDERRAELVEAMLQRMAEWVTATNEFIGEIRLTEEDMESYLEHWVDFAVLEEGIVREGAADAFPFKTVLEASEYRQWAEAAGLDPQAWLRRTTRISTFLEVRRMLQRMELAEGRRVEALQALEGRREELGEQTYEGMRSGLESTGAVQERVRDEYQRLVKPTEVESALLERYRTSLEAKIEEADEKLLPATLRMLRRQSGAE
jgi:hypothetical protein